MKKRLMALCLIAAMTILTVGSAFAAAQSETWYVESVLINATVYAPWQVGMGDISLVLNGDGTGSVYLIDEPVGAIEWTENDDSITIIADEMESVLIKDGDLLRLGDEVDLTFFSKQKPSVMDYVPAPAKSEVPVDAFSGLWKGYLLVDGENRVPANALDRQIDIGLDEGVGIVTWTTLAGYEYAEVIGVVEEADSSDADQTVSVLSLNDASGETLFRFSLLEDGVLVCYDYLGNADLYMSRAMVQVNETVVVSVD